MKLLAGLLLLTLSVPLFGQDEELTAEAPDLKQQISLTKKKTIAISYFSNNQGYGPDFSDYVSDRLSSLLAGPMQPFAVVTRKLLPQIRTEQINRLSKDFDPKSFAELGRLAGADAIVAGQYHVYNDSVNLYVDVLDVADARVLYSVPISIKRQGTAVNELLGRTSVTKTESQGATLSEHSATIAEQVGLNAIEFGSFTKDEDDRFRAVVAAATNIKMLMPNGSNVTYVFRQEFQNFFSKAKSSMQVIFANPDSEFYQEETEMTSILSPDMKKALEFNRGLVELSRARLSGYAKEKDQVQVRFFNTQFRLPMIIVDDKYCFLTIRLSPNESPQSLRLEFSAGSDSFVKSCVAHFSKMWSVSSVDISPKKP
jgi:hypothetical protein